MDLTMALKRGSLPKPKLEDFSRRKLAIHDIAGKRQKEKTARKNWDKQLGDSASESIQVHQVPS